MYRYRNSTSDIDQESFVLSCLKEKRNGYYVELGSGHPLQGNNTALLEKEFGWSGVAFDIEDSLVDQYNKIRDNPCIKADALVFDYEKYFKENNFPEVIDYLQIDIDGHDDGHCLLALVALPMLKYRFRVITIEHDLCVNFKREGMRNAQREILHSLGYTLVGQMDAEDWWVDMEFLPLEPGEQVPGHMRTPYIDGEK